jgi:hypothetical protein
MKNAVNNLCVALPTVQSSNMATGRLHVRGGGVGFLPSLHVGIFRHFSDINDESKFTSVASDSRSTVVPENLFHPLGFKKKRGVM